MSQLNTFSWIMQTEAFQDYIMLWIHFQNESVSVTLAAL